MFLVSCPLSLWDFGLEMGGRVLLVISHCGLFMGLLILAFLTTVLLPPYLLGLVVDPQGDSGLPLTMMSLHL